MFRYRPSLSVWRLPRMQFDMQSHVSWPSNTFPITDSTENTPIWPITAFLGIPSLGDEKTCAPHCLWSPDNSPGDQSFRPCSLYLRGPKTTRLPPHATPIKPWWIGLAHPPALGRLERVSCLPRSDACLPMVGPALITLLVINNNNSNTNKQWF